jgi:hypothetical protein
MADLHYLHYHSRRRISRELDHPAGSHCQMARPEYHFMGDHTISPRCNEEFRWSCHPSSFPWVVRSSFSTNLRPSLRYVVQAR